MVLRQLAIVVAGVINDADGNRLDFTLQAHPLPPRKANNVHVNLWWTFLIASLEVQVLGHSFGVGRGERLAAAAAAAVRGSGFDPGCGETGGDGGGC